MYKLKKIFQYLYNITLRNRRLRRLTDILTPYIGDNTSILDLGCGNGDLSVALKARNQTLKIVGLDVTPCKNADLQITSYDGSIIPYEDQHFDYVMLITVLHHTDDYVPILKEARRVAKNGIIILDHQYQSRLQWLTLAFIDWPGNVPFGVYTPFNFKKRTEWKELFNKVGLNEVIYNEKILMFGKWADFILGKNMHFVSILKK